jgi:hypothetical protein
MQVDTKRVAVVKGQLTKATKIVDSIKIANQVDYELAGKKYIEVKKIAKEFEKEKKEWLDPINQLRNKVFSYTRPVEASFKELLGRLDTALSEWEIKVESERQKEAEKIEAKVDSGDMDLADATNAVSNLESVDQVETDKGKIHQRVVNDLAIDDESKIDRKFYVLDLVAVKREWQETGLVPSGFKIEQRTIRATRLS